MDVTSFPLFQWFVIPCWTETASCALVCNFSFCVYTARFTCLISIPRFIYWRLTICKVRYLFSISCWEKKIREKHDCKKKSKKKKQNKTKNIPPIILDFFSGLKATPDKVNVRGQHCTITVLVFPLLCGREGRGGGFLPYSPEIMVNQPTPNAADTTRVIQKTSLLFVCQHDLE